MSTETIRTIRDIGGWGGGGGPGQPLRLSRSSGALNVHNDDVGLHVLGCRVDILGTKNVHNDDVGLHVLGCRVDILGTKNVHNDDVGLHVLGCRVDILGTKNVHRDCTDYHRDRKPRTSISTFTQLLSFDHPSSNIALTGYAIGRCPLTDSFCFLLVSCWCSKGSNLLQKIISGGFVWVCGVWGGGGVVCVRACVCAVVAVVLFVEFVLFQFYNCSKYSHQHK